MAIHHARSRTFSVNSLFPCFFLTLLAWGLLQSWGLMAKAGIVINILIMTPPLVLSGLIVYRYKHHWPGVGVVAENSRHGTGPIAYWPAAARLLVPIAIGCGLAAVIAMDSVFIVTLSVIGLMCVPWTRLSICRKHFFAMAVLIDTCAALGMVFIGETTLSPYLMGTTALILVLTSSALLWTILTNGNRLDRMPAGGYPSDPTVKE